MDLVNSVQNAINLDINSVELHYLLKAILSENENNLENNLKLLMDSVKV